MSEKQALPYVVSINLLPALGRELLMIEVVVLVASCPAESLIVPTFSLVWDNLVFCLFRRKFVSFYLWELSIQLM